MKKVRLLALLLLTVGLIGWSYRAASPGTDYGVHWDEWNHVQGMQRSAELFAAFPQEYPYNGLYFVPGYLLSLTEAKKEWRAAWKAAVQPVVFSIDTMAIPELGALRARLKALYSDASYFPKVRRYFLGLSLSLALWVVVTCVSLRTISPFWCLVAGGYVCFSWEYVTHARHVATDTLMATAFGLVLAACAWAGRARTLAALSVSLVCAGAAAGLALGAKKPGMFCVIVPLMLAVWHPLLRGFRERLPLVAGILGAFGGTFVLLTPGALLDPLRYVHIMAIQAWDYGEARPGYSYYVWDTWEHIHRLLAWLLFVAPSRYPAVAAILSILTVTGFVRLWRTNHRFASATAVMLAIFVPFMVVNHLLVIRNFLWLVPILAVACAAGGRAIEQAWARHWLPRWLFRVSVLAMLAHNARWIRDSSAMVGDQISREQILTRTRNKLAKQPSELWVSPTLHAALGEAFWKQHFRCEQKDKLSDLGSGARFALFYTDFDSERWLAGRFGAFDHVFSSMEVNYDYYPNWYGKHLSDRIYVFRRWFADEIRLSVKGFFACSR